jgi:myo-inositol catabolism protein IolC
MTIYRPRRAPVLPDWLKLEYLEIEDDPDLIEGSIEEMDALRRGCFE